MESDDEILARWIPANDHVADSNLSEDSHSNQSYQIGKQVDVLTLSPTVVSTE